MRTRILVLILFAFAPALAVASETTITLLHTNDLHSHLMPFSPEIDYIPDRTGADDTIGGWARIATVLADEREKRTHPTFTVDAGDFTMGTLFHMLAREYAFELRLMQKMGYDFATLGNHEFDMFPDGLARIITTANDKNQLPEIVFASAVFSEESGRDNSLEAVFEQGLVRPYAVKEIDGVRVGFYGIIGKIAADQAPFASPVTFRDPVEISREMVGLLREKENVDIVVCLSHSGLDTPPVSEDEKLAEQVPGIDVIISAHSHTRLDTPRVAGSTIIVQTGKYGSAVGVLDLSFDGETTTLNDYRLIDIDDAIPADPRIQAEIDAYIDVIDENLLHPRGLSYWKTIGRTGFDMRLYEAESTVGNFLADGLRWYVNARDYDPRDPESLVRMAIKANGVIRADILKGETGRLAVADIFRTLPLGIGMDEVHSPGYPIVTCYIHAYEIKRALEVITTVYPLKGDDYYIQLSGVKFTYNPYRAPFDRVTGIWMESEDGTGYEPLDYSRSNDALYRVAANIYEGTFLQVIGDFTYNLLTIVPKDRHGNPVDSPVDFRVDADPEAPGVQELKEWMAVMDYIAHFEDTTGDGLPDVPDQYRSTQGRIVKAPSLNPVNLLYRGTLVTWGALGILVLALCVIALFLRLAWKAIGGRPQ